MFASKSIDGPLLNLFSQTAQRLLYISENLARIFFQTLIRYKYAWLKSSSAAAEKWHQPEVRLALKML